MHLIPDRDQAAAEQQRIAQIGQTVLARIGCTDIDEDSLRHPGLIAVVNEVQRVPADATAERRAAGADAVRAAVAAAGRSAQRARELDCPAWRVDLPPVQPHLRASVEHALAQVPARPDRVIDVQVSDWADAERAVFCAAVELLARSWPQMLAELAVCIQQVALLRGYGITGFTDFTTQGAVFINVERLVDRNGLPGALRLAENLVHEGAHTRCYCAAVDDPFLAAEQAALLVATPLRADPRPLFGLFQQLVVLCRCAEWYGRVASGGAANGAVHARHEVLLTQARQALSTLNAHADQLTDRGRTILGEAAEVVGADASAAR